MNADGIIYVPQYNTYRIKVGKIIVEADARTLRQAHSIDMVERALKAGSDRLKNDLLGSMARIGGRLGLDLGGDGYASNCDPIDALYRGAIDPRDNAAARAEMPEPTPDYDPKAMPKIYYNNTITDSLPRGRAIS